MQITAAVLRSSDGPYSLEPVELPAEATVLVDDRGCVTREWRSYHSVAQCTGETGAAIAGRDAALVALTAEIARNYVELRSAQSALAATQDGADARQQLARGWLWLSMLALVGSGLFSILLVVSRTPGNARWT